MPLPATIITGKGNFKIQFNSCFVDLYLLKRKKYIHSGNIAAIEKSSKSKIAVLKGWIYLFDQPIAKASIQNTSIIMSAREISFVLPADILMIVQLKKPQIIPCVIE